MFGKSFVSIYFNSDKLTLVQLNSKKKVTKSFSSRLPEGLIKDFKVKDIASLSEVLKKVWSSAKISEKTLSLVLPEFSTFSKFYKIPAIPMSELDEAVRWQAQDYLPADTKMILDWKIISKEKSGYEVLIIAVEEETLMGYVKAAESAGLLPILVETPSVGLVRFVRGVEKGTLTVYVEEDQAILIVSRKEKIIGTSVMMHPDFQEIVKTVSRMITHYREAEVENVFLGGAGITKNLIDELSGLKLKVDYITPKVAGFSDNKIQEYLIPVSSQFEVPAPPNDPFSINLLPSTLVERYKNVRLKLQVWSLSLMVTLLISTSIMISLGSYLFLSREINNYSALLRSTDKVDTEKDLLNKRIQNVNQVSSKVVKVQQSYVPSQKILNKINMAKIEGIRVDKYQLDFDKGTINIFGTATDRNSLITFKKNLEINTDFSEVLIPLSSFETESNLQFSLSFNYLPLQVQLKPIKASPKGK